MLQRPQMAALAASRTARSSPLACLKLLQCPGTQAPPALPCPAGTSSVLFLGRPGVGKTTCIREMARIMSDELHRCADRGVLVLHLELHHMLA